jgi:16S rRNA (adenine1518-N6/adenine1519-N6)-dimethyltransferase
MSRQKLGQHFLHSRGILERIAAEACPAGCPLVVEIGPGKGALTEYLLRRAPRVVAVELDSELASALTIRWPQLKVIHADAKDLDWLQFGQGVLAGNLPYYIATAIISRWLRNPGSLSTGVFLIQKEVADRITAKPGSRDYGYLSVECQFLATVQSLFRVPPGAFRPPPKVDSAVIRLMPRAAPDAERFLNFASKCFRQKRKTLRNNLPGLAEGQPEASMRAEQLSVDQLFALYQRLHP